VVAKNAAAPEALLTELFHSADAATRRALVTNPATPLNVLQEIAGQFPEELLGNPALDVFLLENPTLLPRSTHNAAAGGGETGELFGGSLGASGDGRR
jgi:hypothetical protein